MARKPRQHRPGDVQHVTSHSIDSVKLCTGPADFFAFISILDRYFTKYGCLCYGFCLMTNHYHLVLRPSGDCDRFSRLLRDINSAFATYINEATGRNGYVFRDRPKSKPTRDPEYIRTMITYVNANPIRASLCRGISELYTYHHCSHAFLAGKSNPYPWLKVDFVDKLFRRARRTYMEQLIEITRSPIDVWKEGEIRERPVGVVPVTDCSGEAEWIRRQIQQTEKKRTIQRRIRNYPEHLRRLLQTVKDHFGLPSDLTSRQKHTMRVRMAISLFSHWSVTITGYSGAFIGRLLGLDGSTVLRAAQRGAEVADGVPFPIPTE